ncbi:heavy metal sensor histidine kinase [Rhodoferax sp.]|uniref:heavy metal sensor histidine kinase n=1 Tax=Rhodoferax sp. TaxID=50421 RepID=UPI0025D1F384|nr:heavy metal sensor histidine kinase [Rhodoferax sp.]
MLALNRVSLTHRLTLMFVVVATSVLLGLGYVVARAVEQHFEELDMEVLSGKMALIRQGLQTVDTAGALTAFTHQLARSLVGHHGLEVMLLDADRSIIFATAQADFDPAQVVEKAARANETPMLWTHGVQTYRVIAAQIPTAMPDPAGAAQRVLVVAATDIRHHQTFMQSFQQTLWLFVAAAAALTGALGWFVVRHGLAPLQSMRRQAQVVTAQQLSHRLPVQTVPPELAELAQSLNDMLARLEVAFERLSDFSSDIAHELRTPVSNLMTQTQVALSRARSASDYRAVLESNAEEFERLARMIADMLLLAKAENGLVVPNRETVDLNAEVTALFDYYDALAAEKNLALRLTGLAQVPADRLMLRRAIHNLLSNAVRHASAGTRVDIALGHTADRVTIDVENCGDPIAPEFLARVFDRFFRVDPSRQRNQEGTGLGLAITRSIVAAHGGTISVTSSGGLTRFSIVLPIAATPV